MLIQILQKELESLRVQYIQMTENWANGYFAICLERNEWTEEDWAIHLGIETRIANEGRGNEFVTFYKGFWNTKQSSTYFRQRQEALNIVRMGIDKYVEKERKRAENNFQASVEKLAARIEKKGLDQSKLVVETAHLDVNITTTLTDGEQTVKAWTIIASGPVQRPHYRYLVK